MISPCNFSMLFLCLLNCCNTLASMEEGAINSGQKKVLLILGKAFSTQITHCLSNHKETFTHTHTHTYPQCPYVPYTFWRIPNCVATYIFQITFCPLILFCSDESKQCMYLLSVHMIENSAIAFICERTPCSDATLSKVLHFRAFFILKMEEKVLSY